jgi:hypothetical protein
MGMIGRWLIETCGWTSQSSLLGRWIFESREISGNRRSILPQQHDIAAAKCETTGRF